MATQIGDVAKRNAQSNRQKITAPISSPLADSGTSHTTKKAAENVPRRGYNFYIQLEATPRCHAANEIANKMRFRENQLGPEPRTDRATNRFTLIDDAQVRGRQELQKRGGAGK
jgi:hypothetical protein